MPQPPAHLVLGLYDAALQTPPLLQRPPCWPKVRVNGQGTRALGHLLAVYRQTKRPGIVI